MSFKKKLDFAAPQPLSFTLYSSLNTSGKLQVEREKKTISDMADSNEIETFIAEKLAGISLEDEVRPFMF